MLYVYFIEAVLDAISGVSHGFARRLEPRPFCKVITDAMQRGSRP